MSYPIQSEDIIQEKRYGSQIYLNCVRDVVKVMHVYDMDYDLWHAFKVDSVEDYS